MKRVPCSNPTCNQRRKHHETPDECRDTVMVDVPDDHEGVAFCSITCACYAGYYNVRHGWVKDPKDGSPIAKTTTTLSADNAKRFLDIIEQDEPNEALKKAAKRHGGG